MNALQTQTTQAAPKRTIAEATIKSANQNSIKRGARLFAEDYIVEQIDATTLHIHRPLAVILAETTQSFLNGGDGSDVVEFYTLCTGRLESEGVVECGCPGYDNYKQCCCHSEAIKQAYAVALGTMPAKLETETMQGIEAAPVVPVTALSAAPIEESLSKCSCGAPVWVAAYRTYMRCYQCEHKSLWG